MDDTYAGSVVCIAASDADDSEDSMYKAYHPLGSVPCRAARSSASARSQQSKFIEPSWRSTVIDFVNSRPLNRRGWVLQERFLARRTLHMTCSGVFWECSRGFASEYYRNTFDAADDVRQDQSDSLKTFFSRSPHEGSQVEPPLRALYYWMQAINLYTRAGFSYRSDTFRALEGLSKRFSEIAGGGLGKGIAGIWQYRLDLQLAWTVPNYDSVRMAGDVTCCGAPSWSWASVDHQTSFDEPFPHRDFADRSVSLLTGIGVESRPEGSRGTNAHALVLGLSGWLWEFKIYYDSPLLHAVHLYEWWDSETDRVAVRQNKHRGPLFLVPLFYCAVGSDPESEHSFVDLLDRARSRGGQTHAAQILRAILE